VGPRAVLDAVVSRKIPSPCLDSIIQPVAQYYTIELSWLLFKTESKSEAVPVLIQVARHKDVLGSGSTHS